MLSVEIYNFSITALVILILEFKKNLVLDLYNISDNMYAMAFKLHMTVDMHGINTHARFDDLDRDFENV